MLFSFLFHGGAPCLVLKNEEDI